MRTLSVRRGGRLQLAADGKFKFDPLLSSNYIFEQAFLLS